MNKEFILIEKSKLTGQVELSGAKNAVLPIMASLILVSGKSKLTNVPMSEDTTQMIELLKSLGASVIEDKVNNVLEVDTSDINYLSVNFEIMKKMRASILVMGPLLSRIGNAQVAMPGGCTIGSRPIDLHLEAFRKMNVKIEYEEEYLTAKVDKIKAGRFILDYPSVGATENIIMATVKAEGKSEIVHAAIEPEVLDLIHVLNKMGADISMKAPASIIINGVKELKPIEHKIIYDRLEAGTLILAAAITQGEIYLPQAPVSSLDIFLEKLNDMGHSIEINKEGLNFKATNQPKAVSIKTMPYPGFPTDLQAPMMAALCLAQGQSTVEETVFENRLLHVPELIKMGANITVNGNKAIINGVRKLNGASITAPDIRGGAALLIAGLAADSTTTLSGLNHLRRGYQNIVQKLKGLGANIRQG